MKKTRINSIVFVAISSILLFIGVLFATIYAIEQIFTAHLIIVGSVILLCAMLGAIGGVLLIKHSHDSLFGDILSECTDCNEMFDPEKVEKQVEHTIYGHMHVSYRCPNCRTAITQD